MKAQDLINKLYFEMKMALPDLDVSRLKYIGVSGDVFDKAKEEAIIDEHTKGDYLEFTIEIEGREYVLVPVLREQQFIHFQIPPIYGDFNLN